MGLAEPIPPASQERAGQHPIHTEQKFRRTRAPPRHAGGISLILVEFACAPIAEDPFFRQTEALFEDKPQRMPAFPLSLTGRST